MHDFSIDSMSNCVEPLISYVLYSFTGAQSPGLLDDFKMAPLSDTKDSASRSSTPDSRKGILRPSSRSSSRDGRRSRSPSGKRMLKVFACLLVIISNTMYLVFFFYSLDFTVTVFVLTYTINKVESLHVQYLHN